MGQYNLSGIQRRTAISAALKRYYKRLTVVIFRVLVFDLTNFVPIKLLARHRQAPDISVIRNQMAAMATVLTVFESSQPAGGGLLD